jgi:hypothetical protein
VDASATLQAADLTPSQRELVTGLLGTDLGDQDAVTVTLHRRGDATDPRAEARERLLSLMGRMTERTAGVAQEEIDAAVTEAIQFVRNHPDDASHG